MMFRWAGPQDFERIKLVGQGDVGKVYLVRLSSSRDIFAMNVLSKAEMIKRNKARMGLSKIALGTYLRGFGFCSSNDA